MKVTCLSGRGRIDKVKRAARPRETSLTDLEAEALMLGVPGETRRGEAV